MCGPGAPGRVTDRDGLRAEVVAAPAQQRGGGQQRALRPDVDEDGVDPARSDLHRVAQRVADDEIAVQADAGQCGYGHEQQLDRDEGCGLTEAGREGRLARRVGSAARQRRHPDGQHDGGQRQVADAQVDGEQVGHGAKGGRAIHGVTHEQVAEDGGHHDDEHG